MTGPVCGLPHYDYPESTCTEPAGHYRRDVDSHAAPLIIDGRECGAVAWDEPEQRRMTEPRPTASTINDAQLDDLYRERDEARQHAAAIAAQRDRLRTRMNTLADRWETALPVDKPYARTLRNEISVAPFDPDGAMAVREYTERGQHLWAFRCWGTETCDGWLGLGHHTQTSALLERERHVTEAHTEPAPAGLREQYAATLREVRALEGRLWDTDSQRPRVESAVCHEIANDLRTALNPTQEPTP